MKTSSVKLIIILSLFIFLVSACNMPRGETPTPDSVALINTIAAQTVEAQLTQFALQGGEPAQTQEPAQGEPQQPTSSPTPSNTPTPTDTQPPPPTVTPYISPTPTPIPCDRITWGKDVTIPDNTELVPGQPFTKVWRLVNSGSCTWNSAYSLVFDSGDAMGAPAAIQLTTGTVAPGQEIDVSVDLVAPDQPGTYQGFFKLRNPNGTVFGLGDESKPFWVKIIVPELSGIMLDFIALADEAEWGSGVTPIKFDGPGHVNLTYGDTSQDSEGFARPVANPVLESGGPSGVVLETHPKWQVDGYIIGRYPLYTVGAGDVLKGRVGFLAFNDGTCGVGDVVFQVLYTEGDDLTTLTKLGEWHETCDGSMTKINVSLNSIKGKAVHFYLVVLANGDSAQDWAIWSSLGVIR